MTADRRRTMLYSLDNAFLLLVAFYLLHMVETVSMLGWDLPRWGSILLLLLMGAVAAARILLIGLKSPKVWIAAGIGLVYAAIFFFSGYAQFLLFAVLTAGFIDMDYRRVLKLWLITVGCAFLFVVAMSLMGKVEDVPFYKGDRIRYPMGFVAPTDFASLFLFLLLILWVVWRRLSDWAALMLPILSFFVAWFVAYSWTCVACSGFFFVAILIHMLYGKDRGGQRMNGPIAQIILDWLLVLIMPLCVAFSLWMLFAWGRGEAIALKMNEWLTHRLFYSYEVFLDHGIHPFGSAFKVIGNGALDSYYHGYYFLDNSYYLILIRYGWVLMVLVPVLWGGVIRQSERCGDRRLALVLAIMAVHAVSEHHLIEAHYTITLVLPLAAYAGTGRDLRTRTEDTP